MVRDDDWDDNEGFPASACYLKVGDRVMARTRITRVGGGSVMLPGHTGVITQVWQSDKSQIVGVRPDDPKQLPMIDIVCMFDAPSVFVPNNQGYV